MALKELSYASPGDPWLRRQVINLIEELSGRRRFARLYRVWQEEIVPDSPTIMGDLLKLIDVHLELTTRQWPLLVDPKAPLVMVANHPFGIGDGIAMLALAEQLNRPYKVLIHSDLLKIPEIRPYALPIEFGASGEAKPSRNNLETRQKAIELLKSGTTIVVFPGGAVATAPQPFGRALEWSWSPFVSRLIQSSQASVLPVYFSGQNSILFHIASLFSQVLRTSLLVSEFRRFAGSTVEAHVGEIIPFEDLKNPDNRRALIDELFHHTLMLGAQDALTETYEPGGGLRAAFSRAPAAG